MRILLRLLFSFVAIIFILIFLPANLLVKEVTHKEIYYTTLDEADVYKQIPSILTSELRLQLEKSLNEELKKEQGVEYDKEFINTAIADPVFNFINRINTEELLRTLLETNIANLESYYNKDSDELLIHLPRTLLLEQVRGQLPLLISDINNSISGLPTCVEGSSTPEAVITCVPAEIKQKLGGESQAELLNEMQTQLDKITADTTLDANDNLTLDRFIEITKDDDTDTEELDKIENNLEKSRDTLGLVRILLLGGLVAVAVIFLLLLLITEGNFLKKFSSITIVMAIAGAILVIVSFIFRVIANKIADFFEFDKSSVSTDTAELLKESLRVFLVNLDTKILVLSGGLFLTGFILSVGLFIANSFMHKE